MDRGQTWQYTAYGGRGGCDAEIVYNEELRFSRPMSLSFLQKPSKPWFQSLDAYSSFLASYRWVLPKRRT